MPRHTGPVLADTNIIIECWRTASWRALSNGYRVETVEECVVETQTGFQNRNPAQQVDAQMLRQSLTRIHTVTSAERASALLRDELISRLDRGEQTLWAHALTRNDGWIFCGPDKASLRVGIRLGFRERLVSLESLLHDAGHRPKIPLYRQYTAKWLAETVGELAIREARP